jgi:hypothetical protein
VYAPHGTPRARHACPSCLDGRQTLEALRARLDAKIEARQATRITPRPPRYDAVFYEGVAWLDTLSHGDPMDPIELHLPGDGPVQISIRRAPRAQDAAPALARLAQALLDALDQHEDAFDPDNGNAYHFDAQRAVYEAKSKLRAALPHPGGAR